MSYSDQSMSNSSIQIIPKVKFANGSPATKMPQGSSKNTCQSFCLLHDEMEQQKPPSKGYWVGFLLNQSDSPCAAYTPSDADFCLTDVTVQLATIMGTPRGLGSQASRLRLALKLASAIIHFHETTWSPALPSSDAIYILPAGQDRECQPSFSPAFPHHGA